MSLFDMIDSVTDDNDSIEEVLKRVELHRIADPSFEIDCVFHDPKEGWICYMHDDKGRKMLFATKVHKPGSFTILGKDDHIRIKLCRGKESLISRKLWE